MSKSLFRYALLGCAAAAIVAPMARADTLSEAVAYAYETDPGLLAQRAALRATDESYVQARAGLGLQANVSVSGTNNVQELNDNVGNIFAPSIVVRDHYADYASYVFSLNQTLFSSGRANARLNAAEAQIRVGRETLRRVEIDLLQRVVAAYVSVRRDEQVLTITADAVKVLEKQLSDTQAKFDVRQVTATDLAQSRARLASARTQLTFAQSQLAISRDQYLGVVGRYPADLQPEPVLDALPKDIDQAFDIAERNNPQLGQANFAEMVTRSRVAEARAGHRPVVSAQFAARRGPLISYNERPETESLTTSITISQPLFASGTINSQIRQSIEENNRDRLTVENVRRQVIQGVGEAWENLTSARASLVTLEEEMRADEVAFYGVREEEKFALRTTLDILNAEAELRSAQLNLVRQRATEYVRRVQLLGTIGALDPRILASGVRVYDPSRNFNDVKNRGQLPWDPVIRRIDSIGGAPIKGPVPATLEDARPPNATALPPTPLPAAQATAIVPATELVARRKRELEAEAAAPKVKPDVAN